MSTDDWVPSARERQVLMALADAIFPIDVWMNQKAYKPENSEVVWRQGYEVLDSEHLASVGFVVDNLLADPIEEGRDRALAARWAQLQAAPPDAYAQLELPNWRRERHLDATTAFAPADSENFTVVKAVGPGPEQPKNAKSRRELYAEFMPHLIASVSACDPENWARYVLDASRGDVSDPPPPPPALGWPANAPHPMEFFLQFGRDLALAFLSLRGSGSNVDAVLSEAGERRRPGNHYTAADASQATLEFVSVLRRLVPRPAP